MTTLNYLTQEGYDRMKIELDHLKTVGRQDVAKAISEAREKGIYLKMQNTMLQRMPKECLS